MTRRDESNRFLPEYDLDKGQPSNEIPPDPRPVEYQRIPSGYDPMGQIELEGRMFRRLVTGRVPWWILIVSWMIFGVPALFLLYVGITSLSIGALPILIISTTFLIILCKSTVAKLSNRDRRGRRRR